MIDVYFDDLTKEIYMLNGCDNPKEKALDLGFEYCGSITEYTQDTLEEESKRIVESHFNTGKP